MSEFQFSNAARLYADNLHVVTAMRELFEQEITQYLDLLAASIREVLHPASLSDQTTSGGYRYWWIGPEGESRDKQSRICFPSKPPEIVTESKLILHLTSPNASPERQERVKQIPQLDEFQSYCRPASDRWALADVEIECRATDLFEGPSKQVAGVLRELHRIDREIGQS